MQFLFVNSMSDWLSCSAGFFTLPETYQVSADLFSKFLYCVPLISDFTIIPHFFEFVKSFFKFFEKLFFKLFCGGCPLLYSLTPVRFISELIYYTTFSEVCQVFFQKFFKNFFHSFVGCGAFVRQLYYYNTIFPICQVKEIQIFLYYFVQIYIFILNGDIAL